MKFTLLLSTFFIASFSWADAPCLGDICVGSKAIDRHDRIGIVTGIEGSKIKYRTQNGYELDSDSYSLSPEVSSTRFPTGTKVIDQHDRQGRVDIAFADGRVSYKTESGYDLITSNVSPEIPARNNIKPSVTVLDQHERVGQVKTVYENGKVAYHTTSGYDLISENVSPATSEHNGIRVQDRMVDQHDRTGAVLDVFENGKIRYRTDNGYEIINSSVTPAIPQLEDGTKIGTVVIDRHERIGTVKSVYRDGRVQYLTTSGYELMSRDVSREVESLPRYVKGKEYASNRDIGEALKFFANGKIELKGDYTEICSELFEEVEEVKGAKRDTEVVMPSGEAKVQNIFSNGLARVEYKDGDKSNVKILDSKTIESKGMRSTWLFILDQQLASPETKINLGAAVLKSDYKKLLDLMKIDLNERDSRFRGEQKKKLLDHIDAELGKISPQQ